MRSIFPIKPLATPRCRDQTKTSWRESCAGRVLARAAMFGRRNTESLSECAAEVGGVVEARAKRDFAHGESRGRIRQDLTAVLQSSFSNPARDRVSAPSKQ